jgi:nicotinamidase-related amidase
MPMLQTDTTCLVLVDLQEKLWNVMEARDALADAAGRLIRGLGVLGVDLLHCEQNPARLGKTIPPVAQHLSGRPIEKRSFSCWGAEGFREAMESLAPRTVLLAGVETHVCVYQTALDLREQGLEVQVVADAVGARAGANHAVGLERIRETGASVTTVETCLFELLGRAEGEAFKQILRIVK